MPLRKDIAIALLQSAEKNGDDYVIHVPVGDKGIIEEIPDSTVTTDDGEKTAVPGQLFLEGAPTIIDHLRQNYKIEINTTEEKKSVYFIEDGTAILSRDINNLLDPARKLTTYTIESIAAVEAAAGMSWETAQSRKPSSKRPGGDKQL